MTSPNASAAHLSRTLSMLGLAGFSGMASLRICDAMLPSLANDYGVTTGQASWVVSAFALAYGILQLFFGPLGDALGKLRVIIWACFASTLICLLIPFAPNFELLVAARTIQGICCASIIPLSMAWVGDQVPYELRQETLAKLLGWIVLGMMGGQWFGGLASEQWGWAVAFYALAATYFMAGALLLRTHASSDHAEASQATTLSDSFARSRTLLTVPRVRWVTKLGIVQGALAYGWLPFVPAWLIAQYGLTASVAGAILMLYGVGGLAYSHFAKYWIQRLGERGLARTGGALLASSIVLIAWVPSLYLSVAACATAGLGFYMLHSTIQTQASQMAPKARATGMTMFVCCLFVGQGFGVMLVGKSLDWGSLPLSFTVIAIMLCGVAYTVSRGVQRKSR